MSEHPNFESADEQHRWTGTLEKLGVELRDRAWKAKGQWAYVVLRGGALVAMRVIGSGDRAFHKQLRIARQGVKTYDKFPAEVAVFQRHMGCADWVAGELRQEPGTEPFTYNIRMTMIEPVAGTPPTEAPPEPEPVT